MSVAEFTVLYDELLELIGNPPAQPPKFAMCGVEVALEQFESVRTAMFDKSLTFAHLRPLAVAGLCSIDQLELLDTDDEDQLEKLKTVGQKIAFFFYPDEARKYKSKNE